MNDVVSPPSPNCFMNNILACSKRKTLAWGTKNSIVFARQKKDQSGLQYLLINDAFKNTVISLAFCPNVDSPDCPELLISGGDEDNVKIWNVDTLELVFKFSFKDSKSIIGVDWSVKDTNIAYAINSEGCLMYCYISYQMSKIISLGQLILTCLASCPHDSNLVAIGTKSGLIYIVQKETILYELDGHKKKKIVSLSWCPSDMNILNGNDKRDLLLASSAADGYVIIWKAGGDGKHEILINMPSPPSSYSKQRISIWIAVCWVKPEVLLISSPWGELWSWNLSTNENKPTYKLLHTYHKGLLFSIVALSKKDSISDNGRTQSELTIWTYAQDRCIICCKANNNSKSAVLEYKISTQEAFIYCIAACDIDTSLIALGVGDKMLHLLNFPESQNVKAFDIIVHKLIVKDKIRAMSWFPQDKFTVAFGTKEGRVGVLNKIGTNEPPILYRQYHRNAINKLEWAKFKEDYFLFSCAEGELVAYKAYAQNDEPMSIIKKGCMEFAWKSNLCLAIALENGSIMFYDQMLKKQYAIYLLTSMVNCLAWHSESTATDKWKSSAANYLAVSSSDYNIIIFDMSELIKNLERALTMDCVEKEDIKEKGKCHNIVAMLNGHNDKVVCLAWSPHFSGHLVSGSDDHVAQVWNIEKQELIGTYMGHNGSVLCCMWNPLKPQFIMTGSSDCMLHMWDYTLPAQSPKYLSNINVKENLKPKNWSKDQTNKQQRLQIVSLKKKEENSYFNGYDKLMNDRTKILNVIKNNIRSKQEQYEEQYEKDDNITNLLLFSKKHLLKLDYRKLTQDSSNTITDNEMNMWCNNLENDLASAAKNKELNDFLVSLASSVSMKTWKEMCETYAYQLIEQGNVKKAVSYLLCIHQIYKAINAFLNANMFKEAYVLARSKLNIIDPFFEKILELWSKWCLSNGQIEQAAHCYVELKQYDKAAKILAHLKDIHCLEIASQLAFLNGDEEYGISLIVDAMTRALVNSHWSKARSLIVNFQQIQYLNVYIDVYEAITSECEEQTEFDSIRMWLKRSNGLLQTLQVKYSSANMTSYYNALCKNENINVNSKNETKETMMKLNASYGIAKAVTCNAEETRLKHLTTALADIFSEEMARKRKNATDNKLFIHILAILDNRKPTEEGSIYAKSNYPVSQSIRAYLCIGLLDCMQNYLDKLLVEEEIQFVNLLLDLLVDSTNEVAFSHQNRICKLTQLEEQLLNPFLTSNDDDADENDEYKKIKEEIDKLKLEESKFREERVCIPNPEDIYHNACSLAKNYKLNNNN